VNIFTVHCFSAQHDTLPFYVPFCPLLQFSCRFVFCNRSFALSLSCTFGYNSKVLSSLYSNSTRSSRSVSAFVSLALSFTSSLLSPSLSLSLSRLKRHKPLSVSRSKIETLSPYLLARIVYTLDLVRLKSVRTVSPVEHMVDTRKTVLLPFIRLPVLAVRNCLRFKSQAQPSDDLLESQSPSVLTNLTRPLFLFLSLSLSLSLFRFSGDHGARQTLSRSICFNVSNAQTRNDHSIIRSQTDRTPPFFLQPTATLLCSPASSSFIQLFASGSAVSGSAPPPLNSLLPFTSCPLCSNWRQKRTHTLAQLTLKNRLGHRRFAVLISV
jgi:hypothetical protein